MKVYFAAPLFSLAEKEFNKRFAGTLRDHAIEVILPQEFDAEIPKDDAFFETIFNACVSKINECDVLLAIVDGPDADSGTCFEVGYAYAKGIPIIAVRTDFRASEEMGVNLMISRSAAEVVRGLEMSFTELVEEVLRRIQQTCRS